VKPLTLEEVKERLKRFDEMYLLELLGVTSEDLVEVWSDLIESKFEKFEKEVDDAE
jgi:NAD(P)H-nitrite reductase large subunit